MGTALTIRDLVGERAIFQREQAVGLSTAAYLLAKTAVFCGFAILQAAIATAIVVRRQGRADPRRRGDGPHALETARAVRDGRRDVCGLGDARSGHLVAGPLQ